MKNKTISEYTTLIIYISTISKIYRMSGNYYDDLIFAFFAIFLNRKLLNQQNLYCVSFSIRRFYISQVTNANEKWFTFSPFFFFAYCVTRGKKLDMQYTSEIDILPVL